MPSLPRCGVKRFPLDRWFQGVRSRPAAQPASWQANAGTVRSVERRTQVRRQGITGPLSSDKCALRGHCRSEIAQSRNLVSAQRPALQERSRDGIDLGPVRGDYLVNRTQQEDPVTFLAERFARALEIEPTVERAGGRRREARLSTKSAEIKPRQAVGVVEKTVRRQSVSTTGSGSIDALRRSSPSTSAIVTCPASWYATRSRCVAIETLKIPRRAVTSLRGRKPLSAARRRCGHSSRCRSSRPPPPPARNPQCRR
jgi:hypothetical protein